jgi:hypothetical protein
MAAVSDLQDEYIDLQKTIDATINTYEEFLESLNKEYNNPTA